MNTESQTLVADTPRRTQTTRAEVVALTAAQVRASIEGAGWSRAETARRAGFARSTLARKLAGRASFTMAELDRLSLALAPESMTASRSLYVGWLKAIAGSMDAAR